MPAACFAPAICDRGAFLVHNPQFSTPALTKRAAIFSCWGGPQDPHSTIEKKKEKKRKKKKKKKEKRGKKKEKKKKEEKRKKEKKRKRKEKEKEKRKRRKVKKEGS